MKRTRTHAPPRRGSGPAIAAPAGRQDIPAWTGWLAAAACMGLVMWSQVPTANAEAQANRIRIEYFKPSNKALEPTYQLIKERRTLEKLQEIFSPLRLPIELTIRTGDCEGVANAWYAKPAISICYEYVHEIIQSMPHGATFDGVTAADAVTGQFFYAVAHEMGHAAFDLFNIPIFGNAEDAADQFAIYIMLQFGKDQARRMITGAAYAYHAYVLSPQVNVPLAAFSDAHAAPAQRYYNLLCLAYGAHPALFVDFVDKGYLPKSRARTCKREYDQLTFAFRDLIAPHLDEQLAKQVMDKSWLPEVKARSASRN